MIKALKRFIKNKIHNVFIGCGERDFIEKAIFTNLNFIQSESNIKKNKVVYTCLTGSYDSLPVNLYLDKKSDYVCFTDNPQLLAFKNYGAWQIRPLVFNKSDNTRNARWHKTHPHLLFPEYLESIWMDANILILDSFVFDEVAKKQNKILIPLHYKNDCIYQEIKDVVKIVVSKGRESIESVNKMKQFLLRNNFPVHYGLNETNIIYRKHNDAEVIKIMEEWWNFIENYSKRDQLSLSFVFWKNGIKVSDISIPNMRFQKGHTRMQIHNEGGGIAIE